MEDRKKYYAHTKVNGKGETEKQLLKEHLHGVADLAASFALPGLSRSAWLAGLLHDIGKYQSAFQSYLEGKGGGVPHALCGAQEARAYLGGSPLWKVFAFLAAGHHRGLQDEGAPIAPAAAQKETDKNIYKKSKLFSVLAEKCGDYSAWKGEIALPDAAAVIAEIRKFFCWKDVTTDDIAFLIRYLYSCLTDADFLDTESFAKGMVRPKFPADWDACKRSVDEKLHALEQKAETDLQKARAALQKQALSHADVSSPVYLLDMPTGSGKTLCSLAFALERARRTGKKRIIYIIPYTSIIEQTAKAFEVVLPPDVPVLRHDSNIDYDEAVRELLADPKRRDAMRKLIELEGNDAAEILKKRTENWDMPVIVTTNVQFFESIYGNRSGKLRKLHNMAESMLVFDEAHTLPVPWFVPCMRAVEQLTAHYRSEALFLTATMPDFAALTGEYLGHGMPVFDLLPDKSLYPLFEKCTFEDLGGADVLSCLDETKCNLVVCNKKSTAERLYRACPHARKYCLSTYLTPRDRLRILNELKGILSGNEGTKVKTPFTVFSTSLIEAGVDLDFDAVYRECAGLDNLLQAAGRCNRNGRRAKAASKTYIFRTEDGAGGEIRLRANVTEGILREHGTAALTDPARVKEYFRSIYTVAEQRVRENAATGGEENALDFQTAAEKFRLIDSTTVGIVIPDGENGTEIGALRAGHGNLRRLRQDSASVGVWELKQLWEDGVLSEYNGTYVLERPDLYARDTGLRVREATGEAITY